jgi:hypothetical protein
MFVNCFWTLGEDIGSCPSRPPQETEDKRSMLMRRRLTPLGRMAFEGLDHSSKNLSQKDIPWVVACRHGDGARMVKLLSDLAKSEPVSPTDFSMSVHNAIIGAYSIATQNKKMHTALSAAEKSFEAGLIEAFALQREKNETIGYLYYDMDLLSPYEEKVEDRFPATCLGFLLSGEQTDLKLGLQLHYFSNQRNGTEKSDNTVKSFVGFLRNDEKRYEIPVPGGYFLWERNGS